MSYSVHQNSESDLADAVVNEPGSVDEFVLVHVLLRVGRQSVNRHLDSLRKVRHNYKWERKTNR